MNTPARAPIPTTFVLLERTKQTPRRTTFDRVQWCLFVASGALIAMAVAIAASGSRGWISIAVTQNLVMVTLGLFLLVFLAWGITHIIEAIQAIRAGFQPLAERVDKAMASEEMLMSELALSCPDELLARSSHLELQAELHRQRAAMATALSAAVVVALNLLDAGEKARIWGRIEHLPVFVYSGLAGLLFGSALLLVFARPDQAHRRPACSGEPESDWRAPVIKAPHTHRVSPVGACIYCGTTNGVLRGFLQDGRQAMGIKGRKSHKRPPPKTLKQTFIHRDESVVAREVPWSEGVKVMHLPIFEVPAFLAPDQPLSPETSDLRISALATLTFGLGSGELLHQHAAVGARFEDQMDVWAFVKLLAKIAHGYHVAIHGLFPLNESPLVPIMLAQRRDARNWIGNTEAHPLPSGGMALHLLQHVPLETDDGSRATAVRIKLFATDPTPTYALATRIEPGRQRARTRSSFLSPRS